MSELEWGDLVQRALAEDLGSGDVTSQLVPETAQAMGCLVVKADGVVAGLAVAHYTFTLLDPSLLFEAFVADGTAVRAGQVAAQVSGLARPILSGERVALNFMQRMSGIATLTRRFVEAAAGGGRAIILDTRKTAPGLRVLDKWAVRLGGGQNHRAGLYDMALIKDNHLAAAGGVTAAVTQLRALLAGRPLPIEVEVNTLAQLAEALTLGVDRIMLDNMSLEDMRRAVALAQGQTPLEASGNVHLDNVAAIAAVGVDYISVGALTHSVRALDISLEFSAPFTRSTTA